MEIKEYIGLELDAVKRGLTRVLDGLNSQELSWRPSSGCNSIGLILFHVVRFEDVFVQTRFQGKPEIWVTDKWYAGMNMTETEAGAHYTVDQVNSFVVPDLKAVLAYAQAVQLNTRTYLNGLNPAAFEKKIHTPRFGEVTLGFMFSLMIAHAQQHIGEISYLRGIQRGMDK